MTPPAHILIVDDEPGVRFVMEHALQRDGYRVETAENGMQAIQKCQQVEYDLVLLDLQMEPVNGVQVLRALHQLWPLTVVIILTAHGSLDSAVEALRLNAFDYLFKPASNDSIRERVRQALVHRRTLVSRVRLSSQVQTLREMLQAMEQEEHSPAAAAPDDGLVRAGRLVIDLRHHQATLEEVVLDLTTTEFKILISLVQAAPQPVSARQLLALALGYDAAESEAAAIMKFHIHNLRKKIEVNPQKPGYIRTIRYKGYRWSG